MIAYHGDPSLKERVVAEAVAHRIADRYISGIYWDAEKQKGCSVGCMLQSSDHSLSESRWGIPTALTMIQDFIFESLPPELRGTWTERYFAAIPVGADLSNVIWQLTHWSLCQARDASQGDVRSAIERVAEEIEPLTRGEQPDLKELAAARDAAGAARAGGWAARAAAGAAARDAARDAAGAAWAAAWAAWDAAWAAAGAAGDAAWAAAWAEKILQILKDAPITVAA